MNIFRISTFFVPDHHLKMDWKHPKELALKEWTIKAFDGKLLLACLGGLGAIPCLLIINFATSINVTIQALIILLLSFIFMNTFLLKRFFAIRLTEIGGEVCSWKALPDFLFSSMPWLIGLYALVIIWGLSQSPEMALGSLASGAGLGIVYALIATSKGYKESQLRFQQWDFEWGEIYEAIYDRKGHAIGFNVNKAKPYIARFKEENENFYGGRIYFHPKMAEEILHIFKNKLDPSITIKEGRIHYRTID